MAIGVVVVLLVVLIVALLRRDEEPVTTAGGPGSVPATTPGSTSTSTPSTSRSSASTAATTVPTSSPSASTTTPPKAVLRGDGLGIASFGAPADQAIAALTAAYGSPTSDSGWTTNPALSPPPTIRFVGWGRLALILEQKPDPTFVAYNYRQDQGQSGGPDLATEAGVRLGDTAGTFEASAVGPTNITRAGSTMRCTNPPGGYVCAWVDPTFMTPGDEAPPATSTIVGFWAGSDVAFT